MELPPEKTTWRALSRDTLRSKIGSVIKNLLKFNIKLVLLLGLLPMDFPDSKILNEIPLKGHENWRKFQKVNSMALGVTLGGYNLWQNFRFCWVVSNDIIWSKIVLVVEKLFYFCNKINHKAPRGESSN